MKKMKIYNLFLIFTFYINIAHGDIDSESYEEVVVSASLMPISIRNSANSITVITADEIESTAIVDLSDLLRDIPGFAVSRSGVLGAQTQIRVRGSEANHILVLLDGIEANNSSQNDEFNWGNISALDIERIEIIRGPQSSMFGSDAMSGVINIVTKKAQEKIEFRGFAEYGSFDTSNEGMSIGLKDKKYNARIGLSKLSTEGENISRMGTENDGYEINNLNFNSNWIPSKNLNFAYFGHKRFGENEYDADVNFDQLIDDQDNHAKFNNSNLGIKINYINTDIKNLEHSLFFTKSDNKNSDYNENIIQNITTSNKNQARLVNSYFWEKSSQRTSILMEHEDEEFKQEGIVYDYGEYGIFDPNQHRNRSSKSIAIEHRGSFKSNISFAVSTRFDNNSEFKNGTTSRIEFIYTTPNNHRIRSTYGSAIKNPTFTERFGYYTNFIGNPNLKPEGSKNFELGFDLDLDSKYLLSGTFFKSKLENEIDGNAIDPITLGYTAKNLDGLSKRQGVELSSLMLLKENLNLNFSYTYTDSTQFNNDNYIDEVRRPKNTASIKILWNKNKTSSFNLNFRYSDEQIDVVYPDNVILPSYTVINFGSRFILNDKFILNISLHNLLDKEYEEIYGYNALGFSANVGIRYKY